MVGLKFLIIGCGSIGERHVSNLKKIRPDALIDVFDAQIDKSKKIAQKYNSVTSLREFPNSDRYDCTFICTPPNLHLEYALKAGKNNSNLFIEKPISANFNDVNKLKKLIQEKKLLAFVGYNFRFNKGINLLKEMIMKKELGKILHVSAYFGQYLPDWRPNQDYKKSYTASKDQGGGIILDSSHEFDYLIWLLGKPLSLMSEFSYVDTLKTNSDAIADIIMKFQNNILTNIHMNYVRGEYRRSVEIICEKGIIKWSLKDDEIKLFHQSQNSWEKMTVGETINDMYIEEIKHVIYCIENNIKSEIIDLENGINTLNVALAAKESSSSGKRICFD